MAARSGVGPPVLFRSQVVFSAPQGALDLATAKPLSGAYTGADIHGLFWSMVPVPGAELGGLKPLQVKLTAAADGRASASTTIEFIDALPEVQIEKVKEFPGAVFATLPGDARRPALIVLGGSEGGGMFARDGALRFASRGFAVLGLPYYSPGSAEREIPELPAAFADLVRVQPPRPLASSARAVRVELEQLVEQRADGLPAAAVFSDMRTPYSTDGPARA